MTAPLDTVTVLQVVEPVGGKLAKTIGGKPDGSFYEVSPYGGILRVRAKEMPIHDFDSFSALLTAQTQRPNQCIIRGGIKPEMLAAAQSVHGVRRLAYDRPDEPDGQAAF